MSEGLLALKKIMPLTLDYQEFVGAFMRGAVFPACIHRRRLVASTGRHTTYGEIRKSPSLRPAGLRNASLVQGLVMPAKAFADTGTHLMAVSQLVVEGENEFSEYLPADRTPAQCTGNGR